MPLLLNLPPPKKKDGMVCLYIIHIMTILKASGKWLGGSEAACGGVRVLPFVFQIARLRSC